MIKHILLIIGVVGFIVFLSFISISNEFDNHSCSVCEWNYVHSELLDYNDSGYGHASALMDIWHQANYGKKVDLNWYENYRLKYNLESVHSFYLINYSNPCPKEPPLKYIGTGYIINVDWSGAYSKTIIDINGTNRTYNNCRWNPYPYNESSLTHVFRRKDSAWWNQFKEASLYDATKDLVFPENVDFMWEAHKENYQWYLDHGGVDVGSEY